MSSNKDPVKQFAGQIESIYFQQLTLSKDHNNNHCIYTSSIIPLDFPHIHDNGGYGIKYCTGGFFRQRLFEKNVDESKELTKFSINLQLVKELQDVLPQTNDPYKLLTTPNKTYPYFVLNCKDSKQYLLPISACKFFSKNGSKTEGTFVMYFANKKEQNEIIEIPPNCIDAESHVKYIQENNNKLQESKSKSYPKTRTAVKNQHEEREKLDEMAYDDATLRVPFKEIRVDLFGSLTNVSISNVYVTERFSKWW